MDTHVDKYRWEQKIKFQSMMYKLNGVDDVVQKNRKERDVFNYFGIG